MTHRIIWIQRFTALLLLIVVSVFLAAKFDGMWNSSVDLAHHYALAYRISEQGFSIGPNDPTLGEMNVYPRAAHVMAAMLGRTLGSTFLGIQLMSLTALAAIWTAFILILNSLSRAAASTALICLAVLLLVSTRYLNLDVHGHEIIDNFFYSQIVGEALLYTGVAAAIGLERRIGTNGTCIALIPLAVIVASTHALPALLLVTLIVGLQTVQLLVAVTEKNMSWKRTSIPLLMTACGIGLLAVHPSFSTAHSLTENNGRLEINLLSYPGGAISAALALLLTSVCTFLAWWRSERHTQLGLKYISLLGFACGSLCIVQFLLSSIGLSSEYAVKKFIFCILSLITLQASAALGLLLSRGVDRSTKAAASPSWFQTIMPALSLGLILSGLLPKQKWLDVPEVARLERQLISTADSQLPAAEQGKSNVVIDVHDTPAVNYMFSLAITRTPREIALPDVLIGRDLENLENYSYILSSSFHPLFGAQECRSLSHGSISIIYSGCASTRRATLQNCFQPFDFSINGKIPPGMMKGFGGPEQASRWTEGKLATFTCSLPENRHAKTLRMDIVPFLHGTLTSQRLSVIANGVGIYNETFTWDTAGKYQIVIPLPGAPHLRRYHIEFHMPDATSPSTLGASVDGRELGFSFKKIAFE